jgi:hypothetical protein
MVFHSLKKEFTMKQAIVVLAALCVLAVAAQGQETSATTRIEKQHKTSRFQGQHMKQTEATILQALEGNSPGVQQSSVQTLRELEQMYPAYSFSTLVMPLGDLLNNIHADGVVRRLAALALDELHSDAGDAAIKNVANANDDKGLQTLCSALLVRSNTK